MSKLIYVHGDDNRLFDVILQALKSHGYATEHATSDDMAALSNIHADIALLCNTTAPCDCVTVGDITLNIDTKSACDQNGNAIHLTPLEFSMLYHLMKNAHRAVAREELLSSIWGYNGNTGTRVADDTAKRLRRKLQGHTMQLETVWNYGFRVYERS